MPTQKSEMNDGENRVVKFRPRPVDKSAPASKDTPQTGDSGAQDRAQDRADEQRRRQFANVAAAIFAVILTAACVWLATTLNHMRQVQDCVAMGMRDCSTIVNGTPRS